MIEFVSEPLLPKHSRTAFACGVPVLDDYLRKHATQDLRRFSAAVFVMVPHNEPTRIAGFYTLSAFSVELLSVPEPIQKILSRYPVVPSILIGRLARDARFPGIGPALLLDALARCVRQADAIGASLVVVDAKDEHARDFYQKHGFLCLTGTPMRLVLPMKTAAAVAG